jgi:hypothetical protein
MYARTAWGQSRLCCGKEQAKDDFQYNRKTVQANPPDQTVETLKLIGAFIGGGFLGAVLNSMVSIYRSRVQPVRYKVEISPVFNHNMSRGAVDAKLTLTEDGRDYTFDSLFLIEVIVTNTGNQNIKEFTLGLTVDGSTQMVSASCIPPDRHHSAVTARAPVPSAPSTEVDYVLKPFNRARSVPFSDSRDMFPERATC